MDTSRPFTQEKHSPFFSVIRLYTALLSLIFLLMFLYDCMNIKEIHSTLRIARGIIRVLCVICLTLVFIKPNRWELLAFLHLVSGLMCIICNEHIIGYLLVTVCVMNANAHFFFARFTRIKTLFLGALLLGGGLLSLSYFPQNSLMNILQTVLYLLAISFILLLQNPQKLPQLLPAVNFLPLSGKYIHLSLYGFSESELHAIRCILANKSYAAIARNLMVSESVVKKMMIRIYKRFGCRNREVFIEKTSNRIFLFPQKK